MASVMCYLHSEATEELANASKDHEDTDSQVDYAAMNAVSQCDHLCSRESLAAHKMSEKSIASD